MGGSVFYHSAPPLQKIPLKFPRIRRAASAISQLSGIGCKSAKSPAHSDSLGARGTITVKKRGGA